MSDIIPNYNQLQPFRFWCQTVLPTVYDESLSYYELLNKVVAYLNGTNANVEALHSALVIYQEYFDNLDVQSEIDKKLDEMAQDGSLAEIINDTVFSEINTDIELNRGMIANNAAAINTLNSTTYKKTDTNYVSMDMLTQEVKTALTGGSTAVVGTNAVDTTNIVNGAVTPAKLSNISKNCYLVYGKVTINQTNKTVTFNTVRPMILSENNILKSLRDAVESPATPQDKTVSFESFSANTWLYVSVSGTEHDATFSITSTAPAQGSVFAYMFNGRYFTYGSETVIGSKQLLKSTGIDCEVRGEHIVVDFVENKIKFPRTADFQLLVEGNSLTFNTTDENESDYLDDLTINQSFGALTLDLATKTFTVVGSNSAAPENNRIIGYWNKNRNVAVFEIPYELVSSSSGWFNCSPEVRVFGDSIAAGEGAANGRCIESCCEKYYGIRLLNHAISGTGYVKEQPAGSTHRVGNGKPVQAPAGTVPEHSTFLSVAQELITAGTIGDSIIFFGGSNDWSTNVPIATFKTAVETAFKTCLSAGVRVAAILPIRRGYEDVDFVEPTNDLGKYLREYVEAIIEVCDNVGVPYLNLFNSGINPNVLALKTMYFNDNAHPNELGYEQLSLPVADFVKRWLTNKYTL